MAEKVAVIGAGEMGHGIAELCALRGFDVALRDTKPEFVDRGVERIRWSLGKLLERNEITKEQADEALARIQPTVDLALAVQGADVVVEAVFEDLELKKKVFEELDAHAPPHALLASNTSGLSITAMGRMTRRPNDVVGLHFFNPVMRMALVEIVKGDDTSDDTLRRAEALVRALGKTPIVCRKDVPGFITSRTIFPYMFEAAWIHDEEGVPKEAIDSAMKFRVGFPMGPFELADQVGIDLLYTAPTKQGQPVPPPITAMYKAGRFGKKTGAGFYDYGGEAKTPITPDQGKDFDVLRILAPVINEAARLVEWDVASPDELDLAMRLGTAFPKGPLRLADEYGIDRVVASMQGSRRNTPVKLLQDMAARGDLGVKAGRGFYSYDKGAKTVTYETITVTKDTESMVATLTLNRPDRLNTINPRMTDEIERALGELESEPEVRCLMITGAGEKSFSAGADVTSFGGSPKPHVARDLSRRTSQVFSRLAEFPKPTLAAINGYCFGGGLELALACDFRIAAKRAKLGQTELNLGLIPGAGGSPRLVKLLGLARAKEIVLLGERLTADEAQRIGLVMQVIENDAFGVAARQFAARLARAAPVAYRLAKAVLNQAADSSTHAALEAESTAFGHVFGTEDVFEGIQAMIEKRDPKFKGE